MLSSKLSDIDEALLLGICADQWPESETLEFKQILPPAGNNEAKLEFVKDVSALANSGGGDLVYGISERNGIAHTPIPLSEPVDSAVRRLAQVLEAGVEPRVPGIQFHPVIFASGGYVLVMRIPASFIGPHRCITERRFVARVNSRTSDMAYDQLRSAFERTATLVDRARSFREARVSELIDRSNWKAKTVGPICALHLVPLSAFNGRQAVDLQMLLRDSRYIGIQNWNAGGWNWQYNLDGLAAFTATRDGSPLVGANQYYRGGAMESLFALGAHMGGPERDKKLPGKWITEYYREAASTFIELAKFLQISGPAILGITLLHVEDYEFGIGQVYNLLNRAVVDRAHLVIPEIWIEDIAEVADIDALMRPTFNILWQCFGAELCLLYGADGKWDPNRIR